jgi:hypothetical protein
MSNSIQSQSEHPVVQHAMNEAAHLYLLDVPRQCNSQQAIGLLKKLSCTISQAACRFVGGAIFVYFNVPQFKACLQKGNDGRIKILLAGGFPLFSTAAFELLVIRSWHSIAPGCGVHVLVGPGHHEEVAQRWCMLGELEPECFSSTDFGIPDPKERRAAGDVAAAKEQSKPARPLLGNTVAGPSTKFFSDCQVPIWADRRVWISKQGDFGFCTWHDRNGFGDALLVHHFRDDGKDLVASTRPIPALPNHLGLHLQEMFRNELDPHTEVLPIIGTEGMRFSDGLDLHQAVFGELEAT